MPDIAALAQAQPASPKLYVFDVGSLKSAIRNLASDRGVTDHGHVGHRLPHPSIRAARCSGIPEPYPDELVKPGGTTVERGRPFTKTTLEVNWRTGYTWVT